MTHGPATHGDPAAAAPPAAVVLAAGAGERLGRRPKCLLELDGTPLIRRLLAALAANRIDEVVVVLGHHAERIAPVLEGSAVAVVRNPEPDAGQVSSQRLGLAALSGRAPAVLVALADQPLVDAARIAALLDAWRRRGAGVEVLHPEVDGERGNPVVMSAAVRGAVLAAAGDFGCRQWQALHPGRTAAFVTADAGYRIDIDRAEDLAAFERATGRALRWPPGSA